MRYYVLLLSQISYSVILNLDNRQPCKFSLTFKYNDFVYVRFLKWNKTGIIVWSRAKGQLEIIFSDQLSD